jgi:DNA-binding MarR family transcriptional regulator
MSDRGTDAATTTRTDAQELRAAIKVLVRRFSIGERADVACCGVTVAQGAALEALRSEGAMRMGALGTRLGITPSTLTRNLSRLEQNGLVAREADPEDARASRVTLTVAGRNAAERVERTEDAFAESILAELPPGSRQRALDSLAELLGAVRRATDGCCAGAFDHLMSRPAASSCATNGEGTC